MPALVLDETNLRLYAESLVSQVRASEPELAARLDFSPRSVWAAEALFRMSDERFAAPDVPERGKELTIFYGGCYLTETLRATLGGTVQFADDWTETSLVFPWGEGGLQVFPFQKIIKRVNDGAQNNDLVDYYEELAKRLGGTGNTGRGMALPVVA